MSYTWGLDAWFQGKEIIQANSSKTGFIVRMPISRNPWKTQQAQSRGPRTSTQPSNSG